MRLAIVIATLSSAVACKRAAPTPTPAPSAPPPVAATAASPELRTLAGRLAYEAAHRPTTAIRLEALVTAAAAAGTEINDTRQYLGLTAAAAYCAGGLTKDGLAVSVCEYPDPAAAIAGRDYVNRRFAAVGPARQIVVRGAATLTTATTDPNLTATRTAVERVFTTL